MKINLLLFSLLIAYTLTVSMMFGCQQMDPVSEGPLSRTPFLNELIEDASQIDDVIVSPDFKRIAYVVNVGDKEALVVDGNQGELYDFVSIHDSPLFSPDSKHFAYMALKGDKQVVVIDGVEGEEYEYISEMEIKFSPDSQHVVYVASNEFLGDCFLVIDGQEIEQTNMEQYIPFAYSSDSKHFAFVTKTENGQCVVLDGQKSKAYGKISDLVFSSSGKHVAYPAYEEGKWFVVYDGKEGEKYEARGIWDITFSPDGKKLAYYVITTDGWFFVLDGEKQEGYEVDYYDAEILAFNIEFSPDSKHIAYNGFDQSHEMFVVSDGQVGQKYWYVGDITYSPDSNHLAYCASLKDEPGEIVVLDGAESKPYDYVGWPTFNSNNHYIAYYAEVGDKGFMVVNDTEGKCYSINGYGYSSPFGFSCHIAFDISDTIRYIVRDNEKVCLIEEKISGGILRISVP